MAGTLAAWRTEVKHFLMNYEMSGQTTPVFAQQAASSSPSTLAMKHLQQTVASLSFLQTPIHPMTTRMQ